MKFKQLRISFLLALLLVLPVCCFAADSLKGDAFYAKGQYKEAIASYQAVVDEGKQSAVLFYNLGNAYFKSGEIPSAILYYEKARVLSPGDEDINFNIRFANAKTVDKIEEAPELFLSKWWTGFILSFSADALAVVSILLVLIGSGLLIVYFFSVNRGIKKVAFFSAVTSFVVGLFVVFMASRQVSYFNDNKQAIVFASVANVKSSPSGQAATAFVLHEGAKVNLKESSGEYIRVKLANGNEGWLKSSEIKTI